MRTDLNTDTMTTADAGRATYAVVTSVGRAVGYTLVRAADSRAAYYVALRAALVEHRGRWVGIGAVYAAGEQDGDPTGVDYTPAAELAAALRDARVAERVERKVLDEHTVNARPLYRFPAAG